MVYHPGRHRALPTVKASADVTSPRSAGELAAAAAEDTVAVRDVGPADAHPRGVAAVGPVPAPAVGGAGREVRMAVPGDELGVEARAPERRQRKRRRGRHLAVPGHGAVLERLDLHEA